MITGNKVLKSGLFCKNRHYIVVHDQRTNKQPTNKVYKIAKATSCVHFRYDKSKLF